MRQIKSKNTKPELALRKELFKQGIRGYRIHYSKLPGKPDIAFTKKKIAIFINGCFWHKCPICFKKYPKHNKSYWKNKINSNCKRDMTNYLNLKDLGWTVVVLWDCGLKENLEGYVKEISNLL